MTHKFTLGELVDGRYELRRILGRGSEGIVYEAWHRFLAQRVALKVVADDAPEPVLKKRRARLLREARVLSALKHPGVVAALDTGIVDGEPYLAMELLEGKSLEALLAARGKLPAQDVVAVLLEACDALAIAHARGVIHRDLKPANVFLVHGADGEEHVKLVDFGTSRPVPQDDDVKLTDEGAVIGTPAYMSPEQLMGAADLDGRSDVYALGAIAFECISGRLVYEGNYRTIVRSAFSPTPVPSLRSLVTDLDPRLDAIIAKALKKERGERYRDVRELASDLRMVASGHIRLLKIAQASTRRRCERAPFISPVHLMLPSGDVDGRCEDISEGGMLFLSRTEVRADQSGEVRFALPIEGKVASCKARVAWARVRPGQVLWAAGLEFVDPPDVITATIDRYVGLMGDGGGKIDADNADVSDVLPMSQVKQTVADAPIARRGPK